MFKYRGKNLKGKWVYGDKVAIRNSKGVETIGIKDTIYHVSDGYCNIIPDEIDPSTLGVCWGMKDKDVDVFTGDTLEDCCGCKGVVVFSIERSEFCLQVGDNLHPIIQGDYYKLIGNIHDNPEIIEEDSCLRYIERNNGGVRTPSMPQMCFGDEKFFYRSVNES